MASSKHGLPAPFKGGKGEDAARFFKRYETACAINKWETEKDKALHVLPLFGDHVFDYASSLPQATLDKYTDLKKDIIQKYDGGILETSSAEQFTCRSLREGETLTEFMLDLNSLAGKAYAELPQETRSRLVRDQFIKALPVEIRRHVLLHPKLETTENLLEEALKAEEVERTTSSSKQKIAHVSCPQDQLVEAIRVLTEKVDNIGCSGAESTVATVQRRQLSQSALGQNVRGKSQFKGVCYRCGQRGHMARDCLVKLQAAGTICAHCGNKGHSVNDCAIKGKRIVDF